MQKGFTRTRLVSSEVWLQMMAYRLKESLVAEPYIPRDDMFLRPKDDAGPKDTKEKLEMEKEIEDDTDIKEAGDE